MPERLNKSADKLWVRSDGFQHCLSCDLSPGEDLQDMHILAKREVKRLSTVA